MIKHVGGALFLIVSTSLFLCVLGSGYDIGTGIVVNEFGEDQQWNILGMGPAVIREDILEAGGCINCTWASNLRQGEVGSAGTFVYETTFFLDPSVNCEEVTIELEVYVDSIITKATINSAQLFGIENNETSEISYVIDSNFQTGTNVLRFHVENFSGFSGLIVNLIAFDIVSKPAVAPGNCEDFELINRWDPLPEGYTDLSFVGLHNIVLNNHGQIVLTDPIEEASKILGVSGTVYGEPVYVTVIDCAAAYQGQRVVSITNLATGEMVPFILFETCSNPGVFFGFVNTKFGKFSDIPTGTNWIPTLTGEYGDELQVDYESVGFGPIHSYSVWLTCGQHHHWDYATISQMLIRDSVARNIGKLTKLKSKIEELKTSLFEIEDPDISCEDVGFVMDLSHSALASYNFLDCVKARHEDATDFLDQVRPIIEKKDVK